MHITKLPSSRWQDYKQLRLEALANSPQSFLSTTEETLAEPDTEWQNKIHTMFFAVTDDDKLVGMAGWYRDSRKKLYHIANIVSVYVNPEYRGKGVGKDLLVAVMNDSKSQPGVTKLQLGVMTSQESANRLYTSLGFKNVGTERWAIKVGDTYYDEHMLEILLEEKK